MDYTLLVKDTDCCNGKLSFTHQRVIRKEDNFPSDNSLHSFPHHILLPSITSSFIPHFHQDNRGQKVRHLEGQIQPNSFPKCIACSFTSSFTCRNFLSGGGEGAKHKISKYWEDNVNIIRYVLASCLIVYWLGGGGGKCPACPS